MPTLGSLVPDLSTRLEADEWMDDFSLEESRFASALRDLERINRLLGGYRATDTVLDPLLERRTSLRLLDVGCGGGNLLAHVVERGRSFGCRVDAIGLDANPKIVRWARAELDRRLPAGLRNQIRIEPGDALELECADGAFDVAHAALFFHHFHGPSLIKLVEEMERISTAGLIINDLHRHVLAFVGIWLLSRILRMSPMVQHDGPVSVRRGFRRSELELVARAANVSSPSIRWHWAFRWTLSTLSNSD